MPTTPNRSYPYPAGTDAATVPAHLQTALIQVDSDMQGVVDKTNAMVTLEPDGTAPAALRAEIEAAIGASTTGLASETYVDDAITELRVSGEVSGTLVLPPDGPRVLELYTVGDTTIGPETFPADTAIVARRLADGTWQRWIVGLDTQWLDFSASNPKPPRTIVPLPPEFQDRSGTANDVTVIPAHDGVQYLIDGVARAAGSYASTGTVTVDAIAAEETVTITGTASWTHEFSTEEFVTWVTRTQYATFTHANTSGRGIYHDPTRPTEYPPVYTDDTGGIWNANLNAMQIMSNTLRSATSVAYAWVQHNQPGDVSVRATVTNGNGRLYGQINGPLSSNSTQGIYLTFQNGLLSLFGLVDATTFNRGGGTGTTCTIEGYSSATAYRYRMDVSGTTVIVFVDDVHYMTGQIIASRITEAGSRTYMGIALTGTGQIADDVEVWVP